VSSEAKRPVTLRMIADQLSIHPSTVSRVLNSAGADTDRWASPEMVQRIRAMAAELNYHPNPYAASLRTARSTFVGVIVPRLQDFVVATIYEGIEEAAYEYGLATFVTNSLDLPENQRRRARTMLKRRVDGLIFGDAHLDEPFLDEFETEETPFVLVNRRDGRHPSVTCDDYLGGRLVAAHLLETGRRNVAVLARERHASTAQDRTRGVVDVFREAGITVPDEQIIYGPFDATGGRQAAEDLLRSGARPDAIFATNDFAAIGAFGVLRDHGLKVPTDVALVGFNDTPLSAEMAVSLTTVSSPMLDMGRRALEMLIEVMRGDKVESKTLRPELVVRNSTKPR
jgi:LacI family transcriptional regulator